MEPNLSSDTCSTLIDNNVSVAVSSYDVYNIDVTYIYDMIYALFDMYIPDVRNRITKIIIEDMILEYSLNVTFIKEHSESSALFIESIIAVVEYDLDCDDGVHVDYTEDIIHNMTEHDNYIERLYSMLYLMLSNINHKVLPMRWNILSLPGDNKFKAHMATYSNDHISLEVL
jgi:hypothetical protein